MADYYPLLAKAVSALKNNTSEARRTLYYRARNAHLAQMRGLEPALDEPTITRERHALEEAIRKVEAEAHSKASDGLHFPPWVDRLGVDSDSQRSLHAGDFDFLRLAQRINSDSQASHDQKRSKPAENKGEAVRHSGSQPLDRSPHVSDFDFLRLPPRINSDLQPSHNQKRSKPAENKGSGRERAITAKAFISYRRDDSSGSAGRIHDRLVLEFGRDLLFMDVDSIPLGANFVKVLRDEVTKCGVLLAVIGRHWLDVLDVGGKRRLEDPNDFVRIEISTALQRDIPVIPILVDGARIPSADRLPDNLKELALRHALEVRHASFQNDTDKLIRALKAAEARNDKDSQ